MANEPMSVTLPYPPQANHLYGVTRQGRKYLRDEGRHYKATAAALAASAGLRPTACPVSVTIDVYRPRRMGDLDNTLKVMLDSLTGVAWADDKQIVEIHARRHEDKANPRAVVTVTALGAA